MSCDARSRTFEASRARRLFPVGILLVGEPRGGRSDLSRVRSEQGLEIDGSRVDEFDFHNSDLSKDVEIEVIVGDLGGMLEQRFLDQLEFWIPQRPP